MIKHMLISEERKTEFDLPTKFKRQIAIKKVLNAAQNNETNVFKEGNLKKIGERINQNTEE